MKTRSWTIRVAICLLIGLALNFAVAYACARWSPITAPVRALHISIGQTAFRGLDMPPTPAGHGFGIRVRQAIMYPDSHQDTLVGWPFPTARQHVEIQRAFPFTGDPIPSDLLPETDTTPPLLSQGSLNAFSGMSRTRSVLPVGAVLNTLLYGVFIVPLTLLGDACIRRNRARRGRCTRCAYDITGVAVCPECGTAAPSPVQPAS